VKEIQKKAVVWGAFIVDYYVILLSTFLQHNDLQQIQHHVINHDRLAAHRCGKWKSWSGRAVQGTPIFFLSVF
jgi:hypothetical protein